EDDRPTFGSRSMKFRNEIQCELAASRWVEDDDVWLQAIRGLDHLHRRGDMARIAFVQLR
ncbi:MAG TPA: hypothetical protein VK821_14395, partial [Dehalococcoidia bacterium]|nr:hypothetical protein [Dehalococcoidia bacterium]